MRAKSNTEQFVGSIARIENDASLWHMVSVGRLDLPETRFLECVLPIFPERSMCGHER
jgi:hypothetical protein